MLSVNNLLSPSNGDPIVSPTQDIVLGLYYMTREKPFGRGCYREGTAEGHHRGVYGSTGEVRMAFDSGEAELHFYDHRVPVAPGTGGHEPPSQPSTPPIVITPSGS